MVQIVLHLSKDVLEALDALQRKLGTSRSSMIREAVDKYLKDPVLSTESRRPRRYLDSTPRVGVYINLLSSQVKELNRVATDLRADRAVLIREAVTRYLASIESEISGDTERSEKGL